jgi:hypothetical protein
MTRIVLALTILAALWPAVRLQAQQPDGPHWTTIVVPHGFQSISMLGSIGMVRSTGSMTFFSSVLRTFTPVPMSASATLDVLENHAVVRDGTTITAYSPWTGTASSITASPSATLPFGLYGWPPSRSVTLVVDGSNQIRPRGERSDYATQAPPKIASHGSTIIAHEGATAYGFGVMNNHCEALALAAPPIEMKVDDAVGGIRTASHIHFHSSRGSLSTISDFPEGWRVQARGTPARIIQLGPPGSVVTMALGTAGAYIPVPPYGILFIDPVSFLGSVPLGTIPPSGVLDLSVPIPNVPALNAVVPHAQNVSRPPECPTSRTRSRRSSSERSPGPEPRVARSSSRLH